MASNMFDIRRAIAMLEVISNQEHVERVHNATHGDTAIFQNRLLILFTAPSSVRVFRCKQLSQSLYDCQEVRHVKGLVGRNVG